MKTKKTQRIFTIIGIILILFSGIAYLLGNQYYIKKEMADSIKGSFGPDYSVDVKMINSSQGYKAYVSLVDNRDRLDDYLWCGRVGTSFLKSFKYYHAEIDKKITDYYFTFLKENKIAYSAHYKNDQEKSIYEAELALNDGEKEYEAKTYLQYLKEWSTQEYRPYSYPYDYMKLNGEHYTVVQLDVGGSYTIEPLSSEDMERNPDSTLMWYMDEFSSQYFTLSNVNMEITSNDVGNTINISFIFTNTDSSKFNAYIVFYIYNEQEKVIDTVDIPIPYVLPNESKEIDISKIYEDEIPSHFKIAYINFFRESYPEKTIVFE